MCHATVRTSEEGGERNGLVGIEEARTLVLVGADVKVSVGVWAWGTVM